MIPRKIYLQYVGDSDEKPTDSDIINDGDITWSRERIFKHDIVYHLKRRRKPKQVSNTHSKKENQ